MKKFLSAVLAAAMVTAMSVPTFAVRVEGDGQASINTPIDVIVRLDADGDGILDNVDGNTQNDGRIYADIIWDNTQFIASGKWNPETGEFAHEEWVSKKYDDESQTWVNSDFKILITNRSPLSITAALSYANLDGFNYGFTFEKLDTKNAEFDAQNNVVVLDNPVTATLTTDDAGNKILPYAEIKVTPDTNTVPTTDSDSPVGTITVALSVTPEPEWQEPDWSSELPIPPEDFAYITNKGVDAADIDRGNYYIGTANKFAVTFPAGSSGTTYNVTAVEGKYRGGAACDLSYDMFNDEITNNGNAGIYYVKITYEQHDFEGTVTTWYAYLMIKQDPATT